MVVNLFYLNHGCPTDIDPICYAGESGVVYRGYAKTRIGRQLVAIKTGKGI